MQASAGDELSERQFYPEDADLAHALALSLKVYNFLFHFYLSFSHLKWYLVSLKWRITDSGARESSSWAANEG